MNTRLIYAYHVRIDEVTDVREFARDVSAPEISALQEAIDEGAVTIERGLTGWGGMNATLRHPDGAVYHARIEECP